MTAASRYHRLLSSVASAGRESLATTFSGRHAKSFRSPADYVRRHVSVGYIGWLGHENLGDEALFQSFFPLFPGMNFLSHGIQPLDIVLARRLLQRRPVYDAVFLGGGTLINANYAWQLRGPQQHGIPTAVFGTGVRDPGFWGETHGRYNDPAKIREWTEVLSRAAYVGVRGPQSKAILDAWGIEGVEVIGDPALALCTPRAPLPSPRGLIGINLGCSGPIYGDQAVLTREVAQVARTLLAEGWRVEFLAMHGSDVEIAEALRREPGLERLSIWRDYARVERTLRRIGEYDLVVGERLHSVILALGCGVPSVMLAYRPKCLDFLESVGLEELGCRTDLADAARVRAMVDGILSDFEAVQRRVNEACDAQRARLHEAAGEVKRRLSLRS